MAAWYNEVDPFAAAWLRELIADGQIAEGDVDERSIADVSAPDIVGYTQCHFFAGIGGWSLALRLAGWSDDRPVWTGSCPCQPFSAAGKNKGGADDRHLWPHWARLIRECRPPTIFGEQVAAAVAHGWLDAVYDDLEGLGYACGAVSLPAASVGAPHRRERVWFVADCDRARRRTGRAGEAGNGRDATREQSSRFCDVSGWCADGATASLSEQRPQAIGSVETRGPSASVLADAEHAQRRTLGVNRVDGCDGPNTGWEEAHGESGTCGEVHELGYASSEGLSQQRSERRTLRSQVGADARQAAERTDPSTSWADLVWLPCRDGKARPTQSGLLPLAHGVSGRVGRLRGYGNAIVPQVAAEVIRAYMESLEE